MRIAIDAEALISAFSGANLDLEDVIRPSILAVTSNIVDDYSKKILLDGSGLGKDWLARHLSSQDKIRYILDDELEEYGLLDRSSISSDYVGAAFLNGHQLITDSKDKALSDKAKGYGVQIRDTNHPIPANTLPGHPVLFNLLLNSKTNYRHAAIRHFFSKEKNIVIYDRYIKESSVCFLTQVLMASHESSKISIISDFDRAGNSIITADEVRRALLKIKPRAEINCYYPDLKNLDDKHDRHIHLGDRLQITFSSGIDCFGMPPDFNNSECGIYVHCLSRQSPTREYLVTTGPKDKRRLSITVRSMI